MAFKLQSLSDYDRFVAVDIGAYRVKVIICSIVNGSLKILGKASTRQSKKNVISGEIADLSSVSDTVRRTILKAAEGLESLPKEIVLSVSSASLLYDSIGTNYVRQNPDDPISMEEVDRMIASTEGKSLDRVAERSEERLGLSESELRLVTTTLTSITLDGKKVSNPIGFSAKNVKFTLVNFFVPSSVFQSLTLIVRDLSMKLVSIVPTAIALPKLLEESSDSFDSNAFVDFGYSKTLVVLENRSEILGAATLDFGYSALEDLLRKERSGLTGFDIEERLCHGEKYQKEHSTSFEAFHSLLFDGVRVALDEISKTSRPRNFFFSGGGATNEMLEAFRERSDASFPFSVALL
jgi:cell division ATPase FtsA